MAVRRSAAEIVRGGESPAIEKRGGAKGGRRTVEWGRAGRKFRKERVDGVYSVF